MPDAACESRHAGVHPSRLSPAQPTYLGAQQSRQAAAVSALPQLDFRHIAQCLGQEPLQLSQPAMGAKQRPHHAALQHWLQHFAQHRGQHSS